MTVTVPAALADAVRGFPHTAQPSRRESRRSRFRQTRRAGVSTAAPDYEAITERQQGVWSKGDFGRFGALLTLHGELLAESVDIHPGERVLDVGGGTGTASLAAARRFGNVTCTDFVPELLAQAKQRADAEGLPLDTQVADAQNLPFDDGSFDVVISTFGAMFAPDQKRVADELTRVCRSRGRIGMSNW